MKLVVFQMEAVCGEPDRNLDLIENAMSDAADQGADLLLAPELAITGYGAGDLLGEYAQEADGAWITRLQHQARETGVSVIVGFPERVGERVFNSAAFIRAESGTDPVIYHKSHLYGDYERDHFRAMTPETVVIDFAGLKIGLLICYDVEFPENVRRLALAGADAVLVPTALPQSDHANLISEKMIAVRAFENQVFVAYGNLAERDAAFAYAGCSHVAAPDGTSLAISTDNKPTMLFVDLNPADYVSSKADNPYLQDLLPDYRLQADGGQ